MAIYRSFLTTMSKSSIKPLSSKKTAPKAIPLAKKEDGYSRNTMLSALSRAQLLVNNVHFQDKILPSLHIIKRFTLASKKQKLRKEEVFKELSAALENFAKQLREKQNISQAELVKLLEQNRLDLEDISLLYKHKDELTWSNNTQLKFMSRQSKDFLKAFGQYDGAQLGHIYKSKDPLPTFRKRKGMMFAAESFARRTINILKKLPYKKIALGLAIASIVVIVPLAVAFPAAAAGIAALVAVNLLGVLKAVGGFLLYNVILDNMVHIAILLPVGLLLSGAVFAVQKVFEKIAHRNRNVDYNKLIEKQQPGKSLSIDGKPSVTNGKFTHAAYSKEKLEQYLKVLRDKGLLGDKAKLDKNGNPTMVEARKFMQRLHTTIDLKNDTPLIDFRCQLRLQYLNAIQAKIDDRAGKPTQATDYGYDRLAMITQAKQLLELFKNPDILKELARHHRFYETNTRLKQLEIGVTDFIRILEQNPNISQQEINTMLTHGIVKQEGKRFSPTAEVGFNQIFKDAACLLKCQGQVSAKNVNYVSREYRQFIDTFDKDGMFMAPPSDAITEVGDYYKQAHGLKKDGGFGVKGSTILKLGIAGGVFVGARYIGTAFGIGPLTDVTGFFLAFPEEVLKLFHLESFWHALGEGSLGAAAALTGVTYYNAIENSLHGVFAIGPAIFQATDKSWLPNRVKGVVNKAGEIGQKLGIVKPKPVEVVKETNLGTEPVQLAVQPAIQPVIAPQPVQAPAIPSPHVGHWANTINTQRSNQASAFMFQPS